MENTEMEGVLTIKKNGQLVAIVYSDVIKRTQIIYSVKEMGMGEIQELLKTGFDYSKEKGQDR